MSSFVTLACCRALYQPSNLLLSSASLRENSEKVMRMLRNSNYINFPFRKYPSVKLGLIVCKKPLV